MGMFQPSPVTSVNGMTGDVIIAGGGGGIADPGSNGILARTALNTTSARTITGTTNQITVTNGDGVSGNPTLSLPQDIHTGASPTFAGATLTGTLYTNGRASIGGIVPVTRLHLSDGSASGLGATPQNRGMGITGANGYARIYYECVGSTSGQRVFVMNNEGGYWSIGSLSDNASSWVTENILRLRYDGAITTKGSVSGATDSTYSLGTPSLYWKETYTDKLFLNSTATLDGSTAGEIKGTGIFTADNIKRGTGMPNGSVTANPGTYYTDTAGTNGAWRWLKQTGTGNTGWVVITGDTGWRSLINGSRQIINNIKGWRADVGGAGRSMLQLRRVNNTVYIASWEVYPPVGSTTYWAVTTPRDGAITSIPLGFRGKVAAGWSAQPGIASWNGASYQVHNAIGTAFPFYGNAHLEGWADGHVLTVGSIPAGTNANWQVSLNMSYETVDAWPTSLPGTAA